jgi:hypothetical protein
MYNFDQYFYEDTKDASLGIGTFGRFGISDGKAYRVAQFYSMMARYIGLKSNIQTAAQLVEIFQKLHLADNS